MGGLGLHAAQIVSLSTDPGSTTSEVRLHPAMQLAIGTKLDHGPASISWSVTIIRTVVWGVLLACPAAAAGTRHPPLPPGVLDVPLRQRIGEPPDHAKEELGYVLDLLKEGQTKTAAAVAAAAGLMPRDSTYTINTTEFSSSFYESMLSIGTPPQEVNVLLDTGAIDTWIISKSNEYCSDTTTTSGSGFTELCMRDMMFDMNGSNTSRLNSTTEFYLDVTGTKYLYGIEISDIVRAGPDAERRASFIYATNTTLTTSRMGLAVANPGVDALYDTANNAWPVTDSMPLRLLPKGSVRSNSYSLWLNDPKSDHGRLLFGGVDHARYTGLLQTVPMVPGISVTGRAANTTQPIVLLNGISVYNEQGGAGRVVRSSMPVTLDSKLSLNVLPNSVIRALALSVGAVPDLSGSLYIIRCDAPGGLEFDFSGIKIYMPLETFLEPVYGGPGTTVRIGTTGQPLCILPVSPSLTGNLALGTTFMRNAYIVVDNDRHEVALANSVFNVTDDSQVEAIVTTIPRATPAPRYSETQTGDPRASFETFNVSLFTSSATLPTASQFQNGVSTISTAPNDPAYGSPPDQGIGHVYQTHSTSGAPSRPCARLTLIFFILCAAWLVQ